MNRGPDPKKWKVPLPHTAPSRQKLAAEYLQGKVPGVMQAYAPDAVPVPGQGWVESDETVHRLAHWREESAT